MTQTMDHKTVPEKWEVKTGGEGRQKVTQLEIPVRSEGR